MMNDPTRDEPPAAHRFAFAPARIHALHALEQAARHAAEVAIARWSAGPASGQPDSIATRAAWYARSQEQLQQWFAAGGFCTPQAADAADATAFGSDLDDSLPFPGSRPRFYTLFRNARSTAE